MERSQQYSSGLPHPGSACVLHYIHHLYLYNYYVTKLCSTMTKKTDWNAFESVERIVTKLK